MPTPSILANSGSEPICVSGSCARIRSRIFAAVDFTRSRFFDVVVPLIFGSASLTSSASMHQRIPGFDDSGLSDGLPAKSREARIGAIAPGSAFRQKKTGRVRR
jgi:hypothetical protein